MNQILVYIAFFVAGIIGGGAVGILGQGIHVDNRAISTSESYAIANQGQATIVEGGRIAGIHFVVTNIDGNLGDVLKGLAEWQRAKAVFSRDNMGWILVYPEYLYQAKTNYQSVTVTVTNKISVTNRTNY